jgi:hypothetical protein
MNSFLSDKKMGFRQIWVEIELDYHLVEIESAILKEAGLSVPLGLISFFEAKIGRGKMAINAGAGHFIAKCSLPKTITLKWSKGENKPQNEDIISKGKGEFGA